MNRLIILPGPGIVPDLEKNVYTNLNRLLNSAVCYFSKAVGLTGRKNIISLGHLDVSVILLLQEPLLQNERIRALSQRRTLEEVNPYVYILVFTRCFSAHLGAGNHGKREKDERNKYLLHVRVLI